jgi:predicted homoserine dehydrogenase-like protein
MLTESEGDQPGVLAMLNEEAISMGFKPLVYANMKGFLAHNPSKTDMEFWAEKQGFSVDMTTSFTDGTKVQIEQTLVANGLGVDIAQDGLIGLKNDDTWEGGALLAQKAKELGRPISDYLISPTIKPGVFIVAEHSKDHHMGLSNYKMGNGPFFVLDRPYHLCYFEILKTIDRVLEGRGILLDNNKMPTISTATVAKRNLIVGEKIGKGIGSFDVRGIAVKIKEHKNHVPIGLMKDIVFKRDVKEGDFVTFDDIEIPDSLALKAWESIEKRVLA